MNKQSAIVAPPAQRRVQRACACGSCEKCRRKRVQARAGTAIGERAPVDAMRFEQGGQPLPRPLRERMEAQFGTGFAQVRVHDDAASHASARQLGARAFAYGQHVHFASGRYAPQSREGLHLLAHELTHTVQQRGSVGSVANASIDMDDADAPLERDADHHADAIVAGQATRVQAGSGASSAGPRLQRRWDAPGAGECSDVAGDLWINKVVVEQETPQSVSLHWSDGTVETAGCSTGKGHCCVDTPDGVGCDRGRSRTTGSNCTPISNGAEFPISDRRRTHNGWNFWNTFVPARGIALHEYPMADGTPLSHGCVRLPLNTARRIFCGERQNRTMVEVRGYARPRCDHPQLRTEWLGDIDGSSTPGRDGEEYRSIVRDGYGHDLSDAERTALLAGTSTLDLPPRCPGTRTAALPTDEERRGLPNGSRAARQIDDPVRPRQRATVPGAATPTVSQQVLEASGFERRIPALIATLQSAGSLRAARRAVQGEGRALWTAATTRAQRRRSPDGDDRPLYWARLEMTRALRGYQPRWTLSAADRDALMALFDSASRGMDSAESGRLRRGSKRILLSGFDPFGETDRGNPSGAAVLALDGVNLENNGTRGHVEGVLFPVRFADFDAGRVESFFTPFLSGERRVDMVMTISQGGGSEFEVEEFAGRRRTNSPGHLDNMGRRGDGRVPGAAGGGGTVVPPGAGAGPEFLPTALPTAVRGGLRSAPLAEEMEVTEIPRGGTTSTRRARGGPTAGSTAVAGSGGNFLSNEIFYRTRVLRDAEGSTVPMGHLHTPLLGRPGDVGAAAFASARDSMVTRIRQILVDTLPSL